MDFSIYKDKKILITGHTGFKGSWLSIWLEMLGANLIGYSLDPKTNRDNFVLSGMANSIADYRYDIRDKKKLFQVINDERPEIIFHLAAQPLVIESLQKPLETIDINIIGTANILEAFRIAKSINLLIVITSDKVYENKEWIWGYRENDSIGGKDPYSASKSAAEIVVNAYYESYFSKESYKKVVTVRAGNVIGGGDWSENRVIPDCVRAIDENKPIFIRNPMATRPWQHVLEPLFGYLLVGDKILCGKNEGTGSWNFGPNYTKQKTVEDLVKKFIEYYGRGTYTIENNNKEFNEANSLNLDISKAINELGWNPLLSFEQAVSWTAEWYKNETKCDIKSLCLKQIKNYMDLWSLKYENLQASMR